MIRFACPRCKSVLETPDHKAGSKIACPKCQQRLQIPAPPLNKTILAPLLEHQPGRGPSQPTSPPAAAPAPDWRLNPPSVHRREVRSDALPAVSVSQVSAPDIPPDPPLPEVQPRPRRSRLGCWLGLAAVLPALVIAGLVIRLALTGGYIRPAGQVPENRSFERTDEEELVKRYILNNADKDADKVKFLTWGPHMTKRELLDLADEGSIGEILRIPHSLAFVSIRQTTMMVRVRYEGPSFPLLFSNPVAIDGQPLPEVWGGKGDPFDAMKRRVHLFNSNDPRTYDDLFIVQGKHVNLISGKGGDDWKQKLRKELSKDFPALKP